jgi:amidase
MHAPSRPPGLRSRLTMRAGVRFAVVELWMHSAATLSRSIRTRAVSSREVIEAFLRRIESVNPSINAVVQLMAERATEEAVAADRALAAGRPTGPLHGVPFTVKDVFETAGIETSVGLPERRGFVPSRDAVAVRRMRRAGGILLGKTNVPPGGAGGVTDNQVYGRTNNPYDLERSVAGSSGGEAALQGAGGSAVGLGSDSGGSIRVPAHLCGVASVKPTTGRVPNTGAYEHPGGLSDARTQIGLLSRFVEDLALALPLIAGPDGHDSGVVPVPIGDPGAVDLARMRIAWYGDDGRTPTTPETAGAVRTAADALASAGATVTEACPERVGDEAHDITERYWEWEDLAGGESVKLLADWDRFRSKMLAFMEAFDGILCPTSPAPAGPHGERNLTLFSYTLPFSLTGQPCVVVPTGPSRSGLPIGVQVAAPVWREDISLAVAGFLERTGGGWRSPPL